MIKMSYYSDVIVVLLWLVFYNSGWGVSHITMVVRDFGFIHNFSNLSLITHDSYHYLSGTLSSPTKISHRSDRFIARYFYHYGVFITFCNIKIHVRNWLEPGILYYDFSGFNSLFKSDTTSLIPTNSLSNSFQLFEKNSLGFLSPKDFR